MTLYIDNHYALGLLFTATGTAAVAAASDHVVGTGTLFLSEFAAGDVIIINGESHVILSIFNDTSLFTTSDYAATVSGAGIQGASMPDLQYTFMGVGVPLGITPPKGIYTPYSQPLDLGDGSLRGGGWASAEWQWGFLPRVMRDVLRGTFFTLGSPGVAVVSNRLYIRTTINDNADRYQVFHGQGLWPQMENRQATRRVGFSLKFRALVPIF